MNNKTQKTLQNSLEVIDTSVLVLEAVAGEWFTDSDTHLTSLANDYAKQMCDVKQLLSELVEFYHDTFVVDIRA